MFCVLHKSYSVLLLLVALVFALAVTGCDSSEEEGPEGTYTATRFALDPVGGDEIDVLAGGGSLSITLRADDTFTGAIFVPAVLIDEPGEGDLDEAFSGTYTLAGSTVTFTTDADLFIEDDGWALDGDRLRGTFSGDSGVITVVLER
jgi:hypothetical protein